MTDKVLTWSLVADEVERAYAAGWSDCEFEMYRRGQLMVTNKIFAIWEALGNYIKDAQTQPAEDAA